jgi:hypothetical protein
MVGERLDIGHSGLRHLRLRGHVSMSETEKAARNSEAAKEQQDLAAAL